MRASEELEEHTEGHSNPCFCLFLLKESHKYKGQEDKSFEDNSRQHTDKMYVNKNKHIRKTSSEKLFSIWIGDQPKRWTFRIEEQYGKND